MGIAKNHVEYNKFLPVWTRAHDAVDGQDAIKKKGTTYLPELPGMKLTGSANELYNLYLDNALWYPATGRTFKAYEGTAFRKPPTKVLPSEMESYIKLFTADGQTMDGFAVELFGEVVMGYRAGILVDFPQVDTDGMSMEEATQIGARPYASLYPASAIVDWAQSIKGGLLITVLVVLEEMVEIDKARAKYEGEIVEENGYATMRRELKLVDGVYTQTLYVKMNDNGATEYHNVGSTVTPMSKGAPLDYIPFVPVTPKGLVWDLEYPLINDVANLNLADYRNEALYRDALLFNGRPTPCVGGLMREPGATTIVLGSSTILEFEPDGWVDILGGGADAEGLLDSGKDLKQRMALVGSRALSEDPRGVEAAETAALHRQGEDGVLSSIANGTSAGMTRALEIMRDWMGFTGEASYTISTDFIPANVDPARMTAIWQMFVAGDISFETYFYYLERGEVYPSGWTKDEELKAIEERNERESAGIPLDDATTDPGAE